VLLVVRGIMRGASVWISMLVFFLSFLRKVRGMGRRKVSWFVCIVLGKLS
jgi:hypothetical protein